MISHSKNRVQAIKSKFENLNTEPPKNTNSQLSKLLQYNENSVDKENECSNKNGTGHNNDYKEKENDSDSSTDGWSPEPNMSYLYNKNDVKRSLSDNKKALVRQSSDPGKKLHRSHAFRCDRSIIVGPKRHGSCNGRSETSDFSFKAEKKLSKERLKRLGNLLEDQMRKENFVVPNNNEEIVGEVQNIPESPVNSIPDSDVPQHILDQYAKVVKPKRNDNDKQDGMTDSGVSSETENLEDEKLNKVKRLTTQFERPEVVVNSNLDSMNDLCASSETMRLERKNPHLILTDTLKKALKQPLPPGPPPKKPPRAFNQSTILEIPEKQKKDTKKMLEKLEQVLHKREVQNTLKNDSHVKNEYDIPEEAISRRPKEIHYLCTEILDITNKTLLPNTTGCFKSLNCAITNNSTLSLPYTRLNSNREFRCSTCSDGNDRNLTTFKADTQKCTKCQINETKNDQFKCHLSCKCKLENSIFFDNEHIYDEPFTGDDGIVTIGRNFGTKKNTTYGTISKSLEDLRHAKIDEDQKIYDIPCDISRPETPEPSSESISPEPSSEVSPKLKSENESPKSNDSPKNFTTIKKRRASTDISTPKTEFEKLRLNFENGFQSSEFKPQNRIQKLDNTKLSPIENIPILFSNLDKPPIKSKPLYLKNKNSKSTENLFEHQKKDEKKFSTEGKRYHRRERDANMGRLSVPKKDSTQLDMDRENLNRLMNEIYDTVTAVSMAQSKPGSFPAEGSDSTSEDSVKLTRSLTEKRKNYVRRVSSRVAYLDTKNLRQTRYRHQTSVCSYKSEILDNPYNTFRSWKSFKTSQISLANKMDRVSTDSKFNLTDSKGNILSMRNDFDSSETIDNGSMDEKTGCVDIELPFEPRDRGLFNVCLLVGLNHLTGQAYVKSVFPSQVQVPPHIENLIFPETLTSSSKGDWTADAKGTQCYSLVLTDERGERSYGYCRRVLPEGATVCLPLCYCLIGKYRAPGFYYKVLQELESHHGSSDIEIHSILQQLFETDFPNPGEEITISYSKQEPFSSTFRNSVNLGDLSKCKTMPDMRRSDQSDAKSGLSNKSVFDKSGLSDKSGCSDRSEFSKSDASEIPEYYDLENNNSPKKVFLSLEGPRTKTIKRPIEPRVDEDNLSILLDSLGAGLTIKVFGTLLLERKVLIMGNQLSQISACLEALQSALYPFVWQQPLISSIPAEIQREVLEAPLPLLAGMLVTGEEIDTTGVVFEEGMLIDLTHPTKVLFYQGDEPTILPTTSYKTLKTTLQLESKKDKEDLKTRNVMISEGFLRFFVDILGDFWKYFSVGELKEGGFGRGDVVFDKENFIKNASSKQNQCFLEWFTETAMFNHFVQNMAVCYRQTSKSNTITSNTNTSNTNTSSADMLHRQTSTTDSFNRQMSNTSFASSSDSSSNMTLLDTPLPDFYDIFDERIRNRNKTDSQKFDKSNYKNAMNKRMKLLKTKLRELVT